MRSRASTVMLAAVALAGCGHRLPLFGGGENTPPPASAPQELPQFGPSAMPPSSGDVRYDAVGYGGWYNSPAGPGAITAAHASLPLNSFAEVTSLDSGRTILVAVTDRMGVTDKVIGLSRAALAQLGIAEPGAFAVRVRRVVPLPADQAALRAGRAAEARGDAPPALVNALRRRLPAAAAPVSAPMPAYVPSAAATGPGAGYGIPGRPAPARSIRPVPQRVVPAPVRGNSYVQVATIFEQANAQALADKMGGELVPVGRLWRVRLGPYDAKTAAAKRDEAIAAGYRDARIISDN